MTAFSNILGAGNKAIADCATAITAVGALLNNTDKINALLKASQLILGDEALLIPQFTIDTESGNEFEKAYNSRKLKITTSYR